MLLSIMEDFESIHIRDLFEVNLNFKIHFFPDNQAQRMQSQMAFNLGNASQFSRILANPKHARRQMLKPFDGLLVLA